MTDVSSRAPWILAEFLGVQGDSGGWLSTYRNHVIESVPAVTVQLMDAETKCQTLRPGSGGRAQYFGFGVTASLVAVRWPDE